MNQSQRIMRGLSEVGVGAVRARNILTGGRTALGGRKVSKPDLKISDLPASELRDVKKFGDSNAETVGFETTWKQFKAGKITFGQLLIAIGKIDKKVSLAMSKLVKV